MTEKRGMRKEVAVYSFVNSPPERPGTVTDDISKNGVTVIVNNTEPAAANGRLVEVRPPKPPPPSLVGVAFHRFRSFRWVRLLKAVAWEVAGLGFLA